MQRLYWWKRRLGGNAPHPALAKLTLVPATVIDTAAPTTGITIRLPNGLAIEVADASPAWVAAVATALARAS